MHTLTRTLAALALTSPCAVAQCRLETLFATNGGGSIGGAVYFELTVFAPLEVGAVDLNTSATPGTPIGTMIYTTPGSWMGTPNWTLAAVGSGLASAMNTPTHLPFGTPWLLMPGTYGIAIVANGPTGAFNHRYTNGNGSNEIYQNADLRIVMGAASNVPFTGTYFQPRVWNGAFHYTHTGGTFTTVGPGCGGFAQTASGNPNLGGVVRYVFGPTTGTAVHWVGVQQLATPLCSGCVLGTSLDLVFPGAVLQAPIPCDPVLAGNAFFTQGADVGGLGGCPAGTPFAFPLTLSETVETVVR